MLKLIDKNGTHVAFNKCIVPDHSVQTFTVKVRSIGGVPANTIKRLIETRHEVVSIELIEDLIVVR